MTARPRGARIDKSFGGVHAVRGVSFDVNEGEILGVIGPNGSGKSTLFNCILGQLAPTRGEVAVDGRDVTGLRPSRAQPPGRQPDVPAAAGLPAAHRAREPDPGRPGTPGHDGCRACSARATPGSAPRPTA